MPKTVRFYFDFISPYSWLALRSAEAFARKYNIAWDLRPIVYAKILDQTGLVGPGEIEVKRRYTWRDVARHAQLAKLPFQGPPAHPFRSLEALRTQCVFLDHERSMELAIALASAIWEQGRDLTDLNVLSEVVEQVGLPREDLPDKISSNPVKLKLRELTESAIHDGVFGVPTFVCEEGLFWGNDRLSHLGAALEGRMDSVEDIAKAMDQKPRGADRPSRKLNS